MASSKFSQAFSSGNLTNYCTSRTQQLVQYIQGERLFAFNGEIDEEQIAGIRRILEAYVLEVDRPLSFKTFAAIHQDLSKKLFAVSGSSDPLSSSFFGKLLEKMEHNSQFLLYALKYTLETPPDQNRNKWLSRATIMSCLHDYMSNETYHEILVQAFNKNPEFFYEFIPNILTLYSVHVADEYLSRTDFFGVRWTAQDLAFLDHLNINFTEEKAHPDPQTRAIATEREKHILDFIPLVGAKVFTEYLLTRPQHPVFKTENLVMGRVIGLLFQGFRSIPKPSKKDLESLLLDRLADALIEADTFVEAYRKNIDRLYSQGTPEQLAIVDQIFTQVQVGRRLKHSYTPIDTEEGSLSVSQNHASKKRI